MAEARQRVGGGTRVVGVMGWPVSGSLSPAIHNAAFQALGLDWVYVPMAVPPGRVPEAITGLRALGLAGANVTMPHKRDAAEAVDERSEDAARLGAVNTIVVGPEGTRGDNTDAPGFDRFLRHDAGFDPAGRIALLFGAGGAARACALALARGGIARLVVAARDRDRGQALRALLEDLAPIEVVAWDRSAGTEADLVVNATPVGADGGALPAVAIGPDTLVVDLLYRPATTPLLAQAKRVGATAFGGLGLLLHQGALSFELWTGQVPPLDVMSAAAVAALADAGPEGSVDAGAQAPDRPTA